MNKFLFLDIDGVLATIEDWGKRRTKGKSYGEMWAPYGLTRHCVDLFNEIISRTPDVKVVMSSSWRTLGTVDELNTFLADNGVQCKIIDVTPRVIPKNWRDKDSRGDEIALWLIQNTPPGTVFDDLKICILDDNGIGPGGDKHFFDKNLVMTHQDLGLMDEDVPKALKLLGSL